VLSKTKRLRFRRFSPEWQRWCEKIKPLNYLMLESKSPGGVFFYKNAGILSIFVDPVTREKK